jgi:hypothetical protein
VGEANGVVSPVYRIPIIGSRSFFYRDDYRVQHIAQLMLIPTMALRGC